MADRDSIVTAVGEIRLRGHKAPWWLDFKLF